jgi:threonine/homoserine/homoserine lactone efflux protein
MLGIHDYWLFVLTGVLLNLTPGQDTLFILGRSLIFLALLPQFIDPASTAKTLAFLMLGVTFVTTGTIWCLVLALGAARLRQFLRGNPRVRTAIDRVTGGLFIALGLRLAIDR